jgi:hypothetical protein
MTISLTVVTRVQTTYTSLVLFLSTATSGLNENELGGSLNGIGVLNVAPPSVLLANNMNLCPLT